MNVVEIKTKEVIKMHISECLNCRVMVCTCERNFDSLEHCKEFKPIKHENGND